MNTKTKILTVSRDHSLMNVLHRGFDDDNYEIIYTEYTDTHLKNIVDEEQPEFIILDIVMPSLDGVGTCLQLRQWTKVPIMMLSTWDTANDTVRGLNLGCDSYVTEPFGLATLKRRIEDTLKPTPRVLRNVRVSSN